MTSRSTSPRWALWVFVAALLLKAAMPMLASASAHSQGKTLVEICSVYGVSMVPLDGDKGDPPAPDTASAHANDHCVLTALAAFASNAPPALHPVAMALSSSVIPAWQARPAATFDASAAWAARLGHGPPSIT